MARHNTSRNRNRRQKLKANYSKAREDAQLHGLIETTPEGAVRPEQVDPATQSEQDLSALDRSAVTKGWEVPEAVKKQVIHRLAEPFFQEDVVLDRNGNQVTLPPDRELLNKNAKVLIVADQKQYERDNPEPTGQQVNVQVNTEVNNQVILDPYELYKQLLADECGLRTPKQIEGTKANPGAGPAVLAESEVLPQANGDD